MSSKMAKRRKNEISEEPRVLIDKNEIMKLTKVAKSWDFTCSFCFKKFPSAQAMGGHQNAHRSERLKEKRLFVRDPIGYRKRAYIRAIKSARAKASAIGRNGATCKSRILAPRRVSPNTILNLHAAARMVKNETANFRVFRGPPRILPKPPVVGLNVDCNGNNRSFYRGMNSPVFYRDGENVKSAVVNLFPPEELRLSESVGVTAGDVSGKGCSIDQYNVGGYQKLDLTLRL